MLVVNLKAVLSRIAVRYATGALFCISQSLLGSVALADWDSQPAPIPGWGHATAFSQDTPERHGLILPGKPIDESSPVIADIDGNLANGLEVAVGGTDGIVHVYKADGTQLWSMPTPAANCGKGVKLYSSPAVGALHGDGVPHVVIGYGGSTNGVRNCDGGVIAFRGPDGAVSWTFSIKAFAKKERFWAFRNTVYSSPAVADVDNDGTLEVGFGSYDRNVYLLNHDGSVRWYYNAADTVWSSPAFANVDNDPDLEMIIGTDISGNKRLKPITKDGGNVYAFKTKELSALGSVSKRSKSKRIGFRDSKAFVWMTPLDQVIFSSPVVADVVPEVAGDEIIVFSGCFFPQNTRQKRGRWIKVLSRSTGTVLRTLNAKACSSSSVAVGDIDADGLNEIVATVNGSPQVGGDGRSRISAWKANNPEPMWEIIPFERGRNDSWGGTLQSPVIADLDGNGSLEVIAANRSAVGIFRGSDGSALTCQDEPCAGQKMLFTWRSLRSTPAVGDVNLDGKLDVVIGSGRSNQALLYGWTNFSSVLGSSAGSHTHNAAPWPMFRGNSQHTGTLSDN